MFPTYRPFRSANLLSREDVANINALYSEQAVSIHYTRVLVTLLVNGGCVLQVQ